jgi:predicted O-linked N-acetylglucosamine transferase (SPINDLY family)
MTYNKQTTNFDIASNMQHAIILYQNGELKLAESLCNQILNKQSMHFHALYLASVIAIQNGQTLRGIDLISKAIKIDSNHAGAFTNLGDALGDLKQYEEALANYERALQIEPDFAEALNNYGVALENMNRYEEALTSYERALFIKPDFTEAHNNKGNALKGLFRLKEALSSYECALKLQPDYADALNNHGNALFMLNRHEDAVKSFARLITINPDFDYAIGNLFHSQLHYCDWTYYRENSDKIITSINRGKRTNLPFSFLTISHSPEDQLKCARIHIADRYPEFNSTKWTGKHYQHDKIRLAYVSADFREHAMTYLMVGLFETHDRNLFETIAISFCPEEMSPTGQRLKSAFNQFIDASTMCDVEVAKLIRELEIDIAIDLLGFTQGHRTSVFSLRPAPIQVNYLGYPGTMGANYIDYILADRHVIPPEHQACYSEKVIYLPDTYQVNDSRRIIAEQTPSREIAMLPEKGFVFCCFNSNYKITPEIFDIWMRLLNKVEGSIIWLMGCSAVARLNLKREAKQRGVTAKRLIFAPQMKHDEHLARLRLADLFLDTLPYNAHTTASDALWAGLPVLTCTGNTFAGRVAGSLLKAIGLPELITDNLKDYEELALKLATTPELLLAIKTRLSQNRLSHPLFNTKIFCRNIEEAYKTMWQQVQQGNKPVSFTVQPTK